MMKTRQNPLHVVHKKKKTIKDSVTFDKCSESLIVVAYYSMILPHIKFPPENCMSPDMTLIFKES